MSELSKKARNRTRVQMVLTMLVIVSIIRQFFLGNYHNMFLGILTLILFMVPQFIDKKLGVTKELEVIQPNTFYLTHLK